MNVLSTYCWFGVAEKIVQFMYALNSTKFKNVYSMCKIRVNPNVYYTHPTSQIGRVNNIWISDFCFRSYDMDGNQFRISFSTNMFHSLASESQILDHVFIQIRNHSFINSANNHEKTKYLCFSDVLMIFGIFNTFYNRFNITMWLFWYHKVIFVDTVSLQRFSLIVCIFYIFFSVWKIKKIRQTYVKNKSKTKWSKSEY